jgi:AcrR family transcriptional regulator
MARPRKEEQRDTRGEILAQALGLFAERGFYGTGTRDIARAVGVRESALYHHFPSKEAILRELLRALGPGRVEQLAGLDPAALLDALGPEQALRRVVQLVLSTWATEDERRLFRVILSEGHRLQAEGMLDVVGTFGKIRAAMARLLGEIQRRGQLRPLSPDAAALAFMGPLVFLRFRHLGLMATPDLAALEADGEQHVTFFWESIRAVVPRKPNKRSRGRRPWRS